MALMPQMVSWKATKLQTGSSDPQPKGSGKNPKTYAISVVYSAFTRSISSLPDDIGTILTG